MQSVERQSHRDKNVEITFYWYASHLEPVYNNRADAHPNKGLHLSGRESGNDKTEGTRLEAIRVTRLLKSFDARLVKLFKDQTSEPTADSGNGLAGGRLPSYTVRWKTFRYGKQYIFYAPHYWRGI